MTVIRYEIRDCLEGMKELEDQSIDVGATDYPFNIDLKSGSTMNDDKIFYPDNKKDIWEWNKQWFLEMRRICKGVVLYGKKDHLPNWITIENPRDYAFVIKKNSQSGGSISHWQRCNVLLFYGEFNNKLKEDYFITYARNGFLRQKGYVHPCPLIFEFWYDLVYQLRPKSLLDPFLGSGTSIQVAKMLGIDFIGYELLESYKVDIEKRLLNCKKQLQIL